METCKKAALFVLLLMVFLMGMLMVSVCALDGELVWKGVLSSSGVEVVTPILEPGEYRIVAEEIWWYNQPSNLAADVQYYTTDPSDHWNWGNHFLAPDGHSFLQVDGEDVYWGPFSNGDTGHTYTIYYTWNRTGGITFRVVDWMDGNYGNNECHIPVRIYKVVTVGGYVVDSNPSEIFPSRIITALMLAVVITVPIVKYFRKTHCRIG